MADRNKFAFIKSAEPTVEADGLEIGDVWSPESSPEDVLIRKCIQVSPTVKWDNIMPTKSGRVVTDEYGEGVATFNTEFPDVNYSIQLTCIDADSEDIYVASKYDRAVGGFKVRTRNKNGALVGGLTVSWLATRDNNP